jgi:hypothetical protein
LEQPANLLFRYKGTRYIMLLLQSGFLKPFRPKDGLKQQLKDLVIFVLDGFAYSTEQGKFSCQFPIKFLNAVCQVANSQSVMQEYPHYHIGF